jgi:hypothetical protein
LAIFSSLDSSWPSKNMSPISRKTNAFFGKNRQTPTLGAAFNARRVCLQTRPRFFEPEHGCQLSQEQGPFTGNF